jgi:hypothetical protein
MATSLATNAAAAVEQRRDPPPDFTVEQPGPQTYWDLVDRSEDALLHFDLEELEHDDIEHARALLESHPTIYKNHLTIAQFIEGWMSRIADDAEPGEFIDGFVQALREIAGHLRDGDFAVEPGDGVEDDRRLHSVDGPSVTDVFCARDRDNHHRRIVLTHTDLSIHAAIIRRTTTR